MKRNSKLLLALSLLLVVFMLAGCSEPTPQNNDPIPPLGQGDGNDNPDGNDTPDNSDEGKGDPIPGTIEGSVHTSTYTGLTFTAPEGWVYATDEEIATIMGVGADALKESGLNFSEEMLKLKAIYDMVASNTTTGSNIIAMYENLGLTIGGSRMSEEDYLKTLGSQLESAGMGYKIGEISDVKIAGKDYKMLTAEMGDAGVKQSYYVRKMGEKYMSCFIVSLSSADATSFEDVMANFS